MARIGDLPGVTAARALVGASTGYSAARVRVAHDDAHRRGLVAKGEFAELADRLGNSYGAAAARRVARGGALDSESEPERDLLSVFRMTRAPSSRSGSAGTASGSASTTP